MLEDATDPELAFAGAYQRCRKAVDEAVSHLLAPVAWAKR